MNQEDGLTSQRSGDVSRERPRVSLDPKAIREDRSTDEVEYYEKLPSQRSNPTSVLNTDDTSVIDKSFFNAPTLPTAEHPLAKLDKEALVKTVEDLQKDLQHLRVENKVLTHFLGKTDAPALEIMEENLRQAHDRSSLVSKGRQSLIARMSAVGRMSLVFNRMMSSAASRKSSRLSTLSGWDTKTMVSGLGSSAHEIPKITMNQRTDLVLRHMDDLQAELNAALKKEHDVKFILESKMEELEIRKAELEESIESFERFKQAQEVMTFEKFIRFMNEWSKKAGITVDKIRLRYSSLKVQYQKTCATYAQKLLIGENLQEVDFDQLRIENVHLMDKIEKKSLLLLELKRMTGAGNLKLSQQKRILQDKIEEKEELRKTIDRKEKEIAKSDDEIAHLYQELEEVKYEYYKLRDKIATYTAPEIIDYVRTKAELTSLKRDLKMWSRRKIIKDMALSTTLNKMKRQLGGRVPDFSWFE